MLSRLGQDPHYSSSRLISSDCTNVNGGLKALNGICQDSSGTPGTEAAENKGLVMKSWELFVRNYGFLFCLVVVPIVYAVTAYALVK